MTVRLSSLRVSADFDSAKYVAGMNAKIAVDKAGAASSTAVGQAVTATDTKVNAAATGIERLSRSYIDGYGSAARFNSAILSVARATDKAEVSSSQLEAIVTGIYKKYGLMADASQLAAAGHDRVAAAIRSVNSALEQEAADIARTTASINANAAANNNAAAAADMFAARTERLRLKFDSQYAASQRLNAETAELAEAERLGVQITGGYEAALGRLVLKYDETAQAAARAAAAQQEFIVKARADQDADIARQIAAANQNQYNALLGVGAPSASARDSAAVFIEAEREAARLEARIDQLRSRFDEGFVAAQRLNAEIVDLADAERLGVQITGGYEAALDGLILKYDATARAAQAAAAAEQAFIAQARADQEAQTARQVAAASQSQYNAAYGIGVDPKSARDSAAVFQQEAREAEQLAAKIAALRAQINPLGAAQDRLNAELAEYAALARQGAISSDEFAAAAGLAQARMDALAVSTNKNLDAIHNLRFNAVNSVWQLQDIAVTAAMGQSPLQIAIQQGTQLTAVLGPMGAAGAAKALGTALLSMINPTSLIIIGLTAAAAAAIQYFMSSEDAAKTLDDATKEHIETISALREAYGEAAASAEDYSERSIIALEAAERRARAALEDAAKTAAEGLSGDLTQTGYTLFDLFDVDDIGSIRLEFTRFADPIKELRRELAAGEPDFDQFQRSIEEIVDTDPGRLRETADEILGLADPAADAYTHLQNTADGLRDLSAIDPDTSAAVNAINQITLAAGESVIALYEIGGAFQQMLAGMDALQRGVAPKGDAVGGAGSMDRAQAEFDALLDMERRIGDAFKSIDPDKPRKLASGVDRAANAYRDLIKNAQDRIDQMKLEEELVGKTGVAADTLRFKLELLQDATDKGRKLDEAKRAEIERLTEAYGEQARRLAELKALEDLQFERTQLGRSETEQRVYEELRSIGLDINSIEGQRVADAIRVNEELTKQKETLDGVAETLADALVGPAEDFFDTIMNGLAALGKANLTQGLKMILGGTFSGSSSTQSSAFGDPKVFADMVGYSVEQGAEVGSEQGGAVGTSWGILNTLGKWLTQSGQGSSSGVGGALSGVLGSAGVGYQAADPLTGGLTGAISGFAAGGPVGAIVGGIAGLLGGMLGESDKAEEELEQAREQLEQQLGAITTLIRTASGEFVGAYEESFLSTADEIQKAIDLAVKAGDQALADQLSASLDTFFENIAQEWDAGFAGIVEYGLNSAFSAAFDAVNAARGDLVGFVQDAQFFADAAGDVATALGGLAGATTEAPAEPLNQYQESTRAGGGGKDGGYVTNTLVDGYMDLAVQVMEQGVEAFSDTGGQMYRTVEELRQAAEAAGVAFDETGQVLEGTTAATEDYAESVASVADAQAAAQQAALEMLNAPDPLSAIQESLESLHGTAAALPGVLEDLGMTAEEAAVAVERELTAAIAELVDTLAKDLTSSINDLSGHGYLNEIEDAFAAYNERLTDAAALGISLGDGKSNLARQELVLAVTEIAEQAGLTADEINALSATFPGLVNVLGEAAGAVDAAAEAEEAAAALESATTAIKDAAAAVEEAAERALQDAFADVENFASQVDEAMQRLRSFADAIGEFRDGLVLNESLSTLSPQQRLNEARSQFASLSVRAAAGDADAMDRLAGSAQAYLEEAKGYYGSSASYAAIFDSVNATLERNEDIARSQADYAEKQLDYARQQVEGLDAANDNLLSLNAAIAGLNQSVIAYSAAERQVAAAETQVDLARQQIDELEAINDNVMTLGEATAALAAATAAYAVVTAAPSTSDRAIAASPDFARWIEISTRIDQLGWRGRGYASGGYTGDAGGVVHPHEFVAHPMATARYRSDLEAMNAGTYRGNDNSRENLRELAKVMSANSGAQIEAMRQEMTGLRNEVRRLSDETRRAADRKPQPGKKVA